MTTDELGGVMEKKKRKKYEKPRLKKIRLDARCAVLGFCKSNSPTVGPAAISCGMPFAPCSASGS